MPSPTTMRDAIMGAIRIHGSMSEEMLMRYLGASRAAISSAVLRARPAEGPRLLYVQGWHRRIGGTGGRPQPFFALGDLPDAPMPPKDRRAEGRRARLRLGAQQRRPGARHETRAIGTFWRSQLAAAASYVLHDPG